MTKLYSVAVYLVDRAYGGPEEGGWWFDSGEPDEEMAQFTRLFHNEDLAYDYRARVENKLCFKLNKGRRSISSVLSEGEYHARVETGLPAAFPAERPRYE